MPIIYKSGDLTRSTMAVLAVPVNTVGIMGAGLALTFKTKWPPFFQHYQQACYRGVFKKHPIWIHTLRTTPEGRWTQRGLAVKTKEHWRDDSRIEWIHDALHDIRVRYRELEITSLALPALGCGKGKLSWAEVQLLFETYLSDLPIDVEVYVPTDLS